MIPRVKALIYLAFYSIMNPWSAYAASEGFSIKNPIQANSFAEVVQRFAELLTKIGIPIAAIFLMYSGFLFVSARGDAGKITEAKKVFWWTIIGTILIVGAYALATAVVDFAQKL